MRSWGRRHSRILALSLYEVELSPQKRSRSCQPQAQSLTRNFATENKNTGKDSNALRRASVRCLQKWQGTTQSCIS